MAGDKRTWAESGLDAAARDALNAGLAGSALWSLLLGVMEQRASAKDSGRVARAMAPGSIRPAVRDRSAHAEHARRAAARRRRAVRSARARPARAARHLLERRADESEPHRLDGARHRGRVGTRRTCWRSRARGGYARPARARSSSRRRIAALARKPCPNQPGFAAHFRIFCLTSAAHERKDHAFVTDGADRAHPHAFGGARSTRAATAISFPQRRVEAIVDAASAAIVAERVAAALPADRGRRMPS